MTTADILQLCMLALMAIGLVGTAIYRNVMKPAETATEAVGNKLESSINRIHDKLDRIEDRVRVDVKEIYVKIDSVERRSQDEDDKLHQRIDDEARNGCARLNEHLRAHPAA
jgi:hypothetical protein